MSFGASKTPLTLIKLGGSLITDKTSPRTLRRDVLDRLAQELESSLAETPSAVVLGHGSGSFGHVAAKKHGTREGVKDRSGWQGYAAVAAAPYVWSVHRASSAARTLSCTVWVY